MKARTIRETEYTWEQIEEILAAGKARETFGEDGHRSQCRWKESEKRY